MIGLTLAEVSAATDGVLVEADPQQTVSGPVVVDSRAVEPGALFVAIVGERLDGHAYAAEAMQAGALAVLAQHAVPGVPCVVVDDTVGALGRLARAVVDRLGALVTVGITGSQGKTTTKDLIAQVLPRAGATVAAAESLNNETGAPRTALEVEESTRFLVVEMGAKGIGHIRYLTEIVPPRIGVVTNVGLSHVGEFGGKEVTARAKGELVDALPADGVAVLNADDPLVAAMADRTTARVVCYGKGPEADVRAENVELDAQARPTFTLVAGRDSAEVQLQLFGEHQVSNALAAAAVGLQVGLDVDDVATALSVAERRARWRMEISERPDGVVVVNDAYNANPDSMAAALAAVRRIAGTRRTWAVLGEMLELGAASRSEHEGIGRLAVELGIDHLVMVGAGAAPILDGAREAADAEPPDERDGKEPTAMVTVPDVAAAMTHLHAWLEPADVVLVKSSRDAGLRYLGDDLASDGDGDGDGDSDGDRAGAAGGASNTGDPAVTGGNA